MSDFLFRLLTGDRDRLGERVFFLRSRFDFDLDRDRDDLDDDDEEEEMDEAERARLDDFFFLCMAVFAGGGERDGAGDICFRRGALLSL